MMLFAVISVLRDATVVTLCDVRAHDGVVVALL